MKKKIFSLFLCCSLCAAQPVFAAKITSFNGLKATFSVDKAGKYAIIAADFEGGRLNKVELIEKDCSKGTNSVNIQSSLSLGDKIMLWETVNGMKALCATLPVTSGSASGDSGIF